MGSDGASASLPPPTPISPCKAQRALLSARIFLPLLRRIIIIIMAARTVLRAPLARSLFRAATPRKVVPAPRRATGSVVDDTRPPGTRYVECVTVKERARNACGEHAPRLVWRRSNERGLCAGRRALLSLPLPPCPIVRRCASLGSTSSRGRRKVSAHHR